MSEYIFTTIPTTTFILLLYFYNDVDPSKKKIFFLYGCVLAINIAIQYLFTVLSIPLIFAQIVQQIVIFMTGWIFLYKEKTAKQIFIFATSCNVTYIFFTPLSLFLLPANIATPLKMGIIIVSVGLYLWLAYSLAPTVKKLQATFDAGWEIPLAITAITYILSIFVVEYLGKEYPAVVIIICFAIIAVFVFLYHLMLRMRELSEAKDHTELLSIQKELEKQLREKQDLYYKLAFTDYLTGLGNRAKLNHDIENFYLTKDQCIPLVYYTIDINGLKEINDKVGHVAGDNLLKDFGKLLQKVFKEEETYLYRVGGDEFAIILRGRNRGKAEVYIYELEQAQRDYNKKHDIKISYAIGYSIQRIKLPNPCREDCEACTELLMRESDQRMYVDKQRVKATLGSTNKF